MALKNQPLTICYVAIAGDVPAAGDAANHAIAVVGDGVLFVPAEKPVEVDPAKIPGVYSVALSAAEMNYNAVTLGGQSSTHNVNLIPVTVTTDRGTLPAVGAGQAGGLPVVDASGGVKLGAGQVLDVNVNGFTFVITTATVPAKQ